MIFLDMAIRNIRRHRVRSLLAMTGIVIGVIAIASLGIMGNSITLLFSGMVSDVSDTVLVMPHLAISTGDPFDPRNILASTISERDVAAIERVAGRHRVIPMRRSSTQIRVGDTSGHVMLFALQGDDIPFLLEAESGVYPRAGSSGVLVGALLADQLDLRPGSRIEVGGESVRVVGIVAERGMGIDINPDYAVIVTEDWYTRRYGEQAYSQVVVKVASLDEIEDVKAAIDQQLNRRSVTVDILDSREILEIYYDTMDAVNIFLLGIGAVSLFVASVSILNVMIISVTERTREIGIMRSIGARKREVLLMFLMEAAVLGAIGSVIGGIISAGVGYAVSEAVSGFIPGFGVSGELSVLDPVSIGYILFGIAFGCAASVIAGLYPAWRGAQLHPIEALRHR
ncbi:MAG: ABC transporter permease [Methanomicrobiaceae archaeon]|nr:ABC transporter permease [Methanomicrobiaceae archaeon]